MSALITLAQILVGLMVTFLIGLGVRPLLEYAKKTMSLPPPSAALASEWKKVVSGNEGGRVLGYLERPLFFGAFYINTETVVAGWLAFKNEAQAKDELRPQLISYRPQRVTSGSLIELEYWGKHSSLPVMLLVRWLPQHGHTSFRFLAEDFPESAAVFRIAIEVPLGATSAVVIDPSGRSRKREIPIDFLSMPHSPPKHSLLRRLFGLT